MFDDYHFYNKGTRPAMLPKQLAKFDRMQDELRAEYLQTLCNKHPNAFFKNIKVFFQANNPYESHFSAKLFYTKEELQPERKAQLDAMYFELLNAATDGAFKQTCEQIQADLGDEALYFYKALKSCNENETEVEKFIADAYGSNFLAITNAEIDEENRLAAELNPAGPGL